MAAITPVVGPKKHYILRNAVVQADTGQTDWIDIPPWAVYCDIMLNITAVAGNTPILTPDILAADPVLRDDGSVLSIAVDAGSGFTTPPTAAGTHRIIIGPGITGIANDTALAATGDSNAALNVILPALMGVKLTLDRTTGDETYTYTLTATFYGKK